MYRLCVPAPPLTPPPSPSRSDAPAGRTRTRAGGRSERIRRQVGRACLALLAEGRVDVGPAAVAARAGVTRATIHRWWPTKAALLREALAEHTGHRLDPPDLGSWEADVRALTASLATFFADPVEVGQNAIMAGGRDPEYDEVVLEHYEPLFDSWREVVERARARGELRADLDADSVILTWVAPLVLVPLLFHRRLGRGELDRHVELLLAATR
jgi:AcrR family transcriptional regulator